MTKLAPKDRCFREEDENQKKKATGAGVQARVMGDYYGYDEWDRPRRPEVRRENRSSYYLDPQAGYRDSLSRRRSVGNGPQPSVINVYNDVIADAAMRAASRSKSRTPPQHNLLGIPYPVSPDQRGRRLEDDLMAEEIAELRLDRIDRMRRSRSRGRSDAGVSPDASYWRYEAERLEREKREQDQRELWKREEERIKAELRLKELQDERYASSDRKRVISDWERRQREEEDRIKDAEAKLKAKMERERRDQATAEQRLIEKMEREAKEKKEAEQRLKEKIEREAREKKDKEKRDWEDFLRKQKEEDEKKKAEKKAEEEKIEAEMRKRLLDVGYTKNQIDVLVDPKKVAELKAQKAETQLALLNASRAPVYAKVHTDYLSIETLRYYDIPWKYDEVSFKNTPACTAPKPQCTKFHLSQLDGDYIIILRDMEKRETDLLFEHTKMLRSKRLLLDAPKKDKQYAFYRERSKSRGRGHSGEWKKFGIFEYKK